MRFKKLSMMLLGALSFAALLNGCGSSSKEGSANLDSVATVGDTACVQCHSTAKDALTGEGIIDQYNKSPHASAASLNGAGCEACHGGGAQHNGVGPIPYTKPDAARCATCHAGTNATVFAAALLQAGADTNPANPSNHANGGYEGINANERCYRCHTGEGAVLSNVAGYTGDQNIINNNAYKLIQDRDFSKFGGIDCKTCHQHGGALRKVNTRDAAGAVVAWDPNNNRKIDQFDLCTSCHTYQNPDGTIVASGTAASGTAPYYHNTAWYRIIASTHYDNPATGVGLATNLVEGYVIKTTGANPCFDCHGHEAKTNTRQNSSSGPRPATIHTDWARSAHAGGLLNQKEAAAKNADGTWKATNSALTDTVMAAGVDAASGPAWEHYDWDSASRQSCQRCHTSTGAANFMANPATYVAANNSFTHLAGWTSTTKTSPQNELLYCWGCHTNAGTGALRTPGAITETYAAATAGDPVTTVAYPDAGNSNVCMTCHLGRESGDVIKNDQDADGVRSFVNSHYLTAGGTVFGKTGYTLFGRDYDSTPKGFVHDKLGVSASGTAAADAYIAANGLGKSGPCAVCHMTSEKAGAKASHTYSPFSEYAAGDVSLNPVCVTCHSTRGAGTDAKATWFEGTWKKRADAGLEALNAALVAKGIYFFNAHPYFYNGAGGTGGAFTNWAGVNGFAEWKNVMGVAFNYNLLEHDPGAVAHNRYYVRRLIYDSLDYLDDYTANYSVFATLNALPAATTYKADAITFLISRGTADANVGTAAERY